MRNYLLFESEFDRLKDLFLLEAEENDDDDLAEATNEDSGEDAGKEPAQNGFYDNMWRSSTELFYVVYKIK